MTVERITNRHWSRSRSLLSVVVAVILFGGCDSQPSKGQASAAAKRPVSRLPQEIPFRGDRAYQILKDICAIGSRTSGTPGMKEQQEMLTKHFHAAGGEVSRQEFRVRHPLTGESVPMANLIVSWNPEKLKRILLCAHYDTRPYPDQDPDRRRRKDLFVGANDGASGVAVLSELAQHMNDLKIPYGIDFVLFDGEELVYAGQQDPKYFLGSTHFAQQYVQKQTEQRYRFGVLLDMVGDANLEIYWERNSMRYRESAALVKDIWRVAKRLGVTEFKSRIGHEIRDDHLPLLNIARIPSCDIIDFDYPKPGRGTSYWHTTADTPDKCSAESLAKVGYVMLEWLKTLE